MALGINSGASAQDAVVVKVEAFEAADVADTEVLATSFNDAVEALDEDVGKVVAVVVAVAVTGLRTAAAGIAVSGDAAATALGNAVEVVDVIVGGCAAGIISLFVAPPLNSGAKGLRGGNCWPWLKRQLSPYAHVPALKYLQGNVFLLANERSCE